MAQRSSSRTLPLGWIGLAAGGLLLAGLLTAFFLGRREVLLPGRTSDGHHVLEAACASCHTPFSPVGNDGCRRCHQPELTDDTHAASMFDDPRWSASLAALDVRTCTTCHGEHRVAARGVTIDRTFCYRCHDDVTERRPSHAGLEPGSCMDGGCHNYHDNTALNAAFLGKRLERGKPAEPVRPAWGKPRAPAPAEPAAASRPASEAIARLREVRAAWQGSVHAARDVACLACHGARDLDPEPPAEMVHAEEACARCHGFEQETFGQGKHGVRQKLGLPALRPEDARRKMAPPGPARPDHVGCGTCHDPHSLDTTAAAVDACLRCHADEHSLAFRASPHGATAGQVVEGRPAPMAVTCATCHLPRVTVADAGGQGRTAVNHNNSFTLAPRDRMVKLVCLDCHDLTLSLSAIMDENSVRTNFRGQPKAVHPTVPMLQAPRERRSRP